MAGKTVITMTAGFVLSAISGLALGEFAITEPNAVNAPFAIADRTGNPDAAYGPPPEILAENARLNEGAPIAPVCKGCGPTLAQRRASAYYGDDYQPFEDSGDSDYEYTEDPAQRSSPVQTANPERYYRPPGYTPPEVYKPVPVTDTTPIPPPFAVTISE